MRDRCFLHRRLALVLKLGWRRIFGCVTGIAKSQRKLKREQMLLARNQMDLLDRQCHLQAQISGQNPGPFRPRQWPVLEVSDDFADALEEEEHSDAGDGN
ncbi:hypothetical protein RHGRI_004600 [Rhododendron griersonianum]|uniref:Uncharacterized protein n=1 Tax=Rhododendron griersonianum TaxID=479676 RepID=A0AAV6LA01_9ERIC|nr:hypothetical protein RHGRI_004600 [Rhododendron griersonianum]